MCRDAVNNALKSLIEKGLLEKKQTGENGVAKTWYSIRVQPIIEDNDPENEDDYDPNTEDSNNSYQSSKTTPPSRLKRPTKETPTKETKSPIVPKGDPIASSATRKKIREKKEEKAPRVLITPSQHDSLLKRAQGDKQLLESWYEELSAWKIGKEIYGGANDYRAIINWVIDAVEKKGDSPKASKEKNLDADRKFAKKVENKFPQLVQSGEICVGNGYIEFILGRESDHIRFGEGGFRDRVLNRLRKMQKNVDEL